MLILLQKMWKKTQKRIIKVNAIGDKAKKQACRKESYSDTP